jgi:hypothetical protein
VLQARVLEEEMSRKAQASNPRKKPVVLSNFLGKKWSILVKQAQVLQARVLEEEMSRKAQASNPRKNPVVLPNFLDKITQHQKCPLS